MTNPYLWALSLSLRRSATLAQAPFRRVIICFTSLRSPLLISSFLRNCFSNPSPINLTHPALFSSPNPNPNPPHLHHWSSKESRCHTVYCLCVSLDLCLSRHPVPSHSLASSLSFFFPVIAHYTVVSELKLCCGKFPSYRPLDHSLHSWPASQDYQWSSQM